jgi:hypothetical protein
MSALTQGGVNMRQNSRITGRRMCAAVALAMVTAWGIPAVAPTAPADSPVASAAAARSAPQSPQVHHPDTYALDTYTTCTDVLENFGYEITAEMIYGCELGADYPGNPIVGMAGCAGWLWLSGVSLFHAVIACGAAPTPGFAEEEWCYYNGGYACLNAWGGGPFVDAYTGGPETTDANQDFALIYNYATGYYELAFTGSGSWSGECIGDANNNSGDADVSLDPCGTASGNQGWGTNMTWGTSGCPSGEAWFYDYHWGGYLGPPDNWVNGSPFYLNKPGYLCFSYTLEN